MHALFNWFVSFFEVDFGEIRFDVEADDIVTDLNTAYGKRA